jgi:hypothetical protein
MREKSAMCAVDISGACCHRSQDEFTVRLDVDECGFFENHGQSSTYHARSVLHLRPR